MRKIKKMIFMTSAITLLFLSAVNNTANADTASVWTTKTVNGRAYKFNSEVWNRPKSVQAVAQVKTSDSMNAKAGYDEEVETTVFKRSGEVLSYGSGLQVNEEGEEPDLIGAVGINGINGYVKTDDLCPNVSNPAEACAITQELAEGYTIPVYDLEGNIIDQFAVGE